MNQRVAVTLLQKWGHTTVLASNGLEAVEKSTEEEFDLILMDVRTFECFTSQVSCLEFDHVSPISGSVRSWLHSL